MARHRIEKELRREGGKKASRLRPYRKASKTKVNKKTENRGNEGDSAT